MFMGITRQDHWPVCLPMASIFSIRKQLRELHCHRTHLKTGWGEKPTPTQGRTASQISNKYRIPYPESPSYYRYEKGAKVRRSLAFACKDCGFHVWWTPRRIGCGLVSHWFTETLKAMLAVVSEQNNLGSHAHTVARSGALRSSALRLRVEQRSKYAREVGGQVENLSA